MCLCSQPSYTARREILFRQLLPPQNSCTAIAFHELVHSSSHMITGFEGWWCRHCWRLWTTFVLCCFNGVEVFVIFSWVAICCGKARLWSQAGGGLLPRLMRNTRGVGTSTLSGANAPCGLPRTPCSPPINGRSRRAAGAVEKRHHSPITPWLT